MMTFEQLYPTANTTTWATQPFQGFCLDSRNVQAGQIFVALRSATQSNLDVVMGYIEKALNAGAIGVITEIEQIHHDKVLYIADLRALLGSFQQRYLQAQQAQTLARVVAVTGTNGKTTISRLIAELLTLLQQPTAVMGTTGNGILPNLQPSTHTTLDAIQLQTSYYQYSQAGAKFLALEASSHGLDQHRLTGLPIEVASFSNLSRDHLDYHGDLQHYAQAKAQLFAFPSLKYAIINQDDEYADVMMAEAKRNSLCQILTYSMLLDEMNHRPTSAPKADYWISDVTYSLQGASFTLYTPSGEYFHVQSPLLGKFNVANVLASIISVEKLGFALKDIIPLVPQLKGASGRMQTISHQERLFIVDYAHTPDALQQVLTSLRHHVTGKLWAVFGCGGDRDRGKRPLMTQAGVDYADTLILTTDNPRTESVEQIMADMVQGVQFKATPQQILDRREAIKYAVKHAQAGDIVVIAGKGHENYQEIDGVRHWFDDVVEVQSAIEQLGCDLPNTYAV